MVEGVEDERGELEHVLVSVVEPRATREREDGGRAVDGNASELDGARAEEAVASGVKSATSSKRGGGENPPSPSIGKLTADRIEDGAKEDTVLETNVDEEGRVVLVDASVEDLGDDDG